MGGSPQYSQAPVQREVVNRGSLGVYLTFFVLLAVIAAVIAFSYVALSGAARAKMELRNAQSDYAELRADSQNEERRILQLRAQNAELIKKNKLLKGELAALMAAKKR